jgi:hypothetical protein
MIYESENIYNKTQSAKTHFLQFVYHVERELMCIEKQYK